MNVLFIIILFYPCCEPAAFGYIAGRDYKNYVIHLCDYDTLFSLYIYSN